MLTISIKRMALFRQETEFIQHTLLISGPRYSKITKSHTYTNNYSYIYINNIYYTQDIQTKIINILYFLAAYARYSNRLDQVQTI